MTSPTPLPAWLCSEPPQAQDTVAQTVAHSTTVRDLIYTQFGNAFESIMDKVSSGWDLSAVLREDFRQFDYGLFIRWMNRDPERKRQYEEAKELRTDYLDGKMMRHALGQNDDGTPSIEDVQRSKLVVETIKWRMAADNRRRYGDSKSIEFGGTISIIGALKQAEERAALTLREPDELSIEDATFAQLGEAFSAAMEPAPVQEDDDA